MISSASSRSSRAVPRQAMCWSGRTSMSRRTALGMSRRPGHSARSTCPWGIDSATPRRNAGARHGTWSESGPGTGPSLAPYRAVGCRDNSGPRCCHRRSRQDSGSAVALPSHRPREALPSRPRHPASALSKATSHRASTAGSSFTTPCSTGSISTCETRIGASPGMLPSLFLRIKHRHSLTLG